MNRSIICLLVLATAVVSGCREACSRDEVRFGDRCVLRPDSGIFGDEDASTTDEDGGPPDDEMDAWAGPTEEDASTPSPGAPDDDDGGDGIGDGGTEPPLCPDDAGCHRKVAHFTYGAPGCAILDDGTLWCWGGVDGPRVPRQVGTASGWQAVSSTDNVMDEFARRSRPGNHACGVREGALYCWGENYNAQLGLGSVEDLQLVAPAPRRVGETTDWTAVSTAAIPLAGAVSCGLRAGAVYCWGGSARPEPTRIGSRSDWTSLSAGVPLTCGIAGGMAQCFDVAAKDAIDRSVTPWTDWQMVSSGGTHACGLRRGKAYCWGDNVYGQLGIENAGSTVASPAPVGTDEDWTFIDTSLTQTCAIRAGELYCWGALALRDVIAEPATQVLTLRPLRIGEHSDWTAVDVGLRGACGRRTNGQLLCWGNNSNGQLGTERIATQWMNEPTQVSGGGDNWLHVATGATSTCGLRGGELYCWGTLRERSPSGAPILGSFSPARIGTATDWTTLAMHFDADHACALRNPDTSPGSYLWCWGDGSLGQLGPTVTALSSRDPISISGATAWIDVAVGPDTTCGRTLGSAPRCWGGSWMEASPTIGSGPLKGGEWGAFGTTKGIYDGRLAEWTSTTAATYSDISYETGWTKIAPGENHTCGIRNGQLYCWGDNSRGQLGTGVEALNLTASYPAPVSSPSLWISIATRDGASCGVRSDKTLWCWGGGRTRWISDVDVQITPEPRLVPGEWETVSLGGEHGCAIASNGTLWCWGRNLDGQLGLGEYRSDEMQLVELRL